MQKFWSATLAEKFIFPYSLEDSAALEGHIDCNKQWFAEPRTDINSLLEEVSRKQKETRETYIVFQFYIPETRMQELVSCAFQGNFVTVTAMPSPNKGFGVRIIEYFTVHQKE